MKTFNIYTYSATRDDVVNGASISKGAPLVLVLSDMNHAEIETAEKQGLEREKWAAAIFPITPKFDHDSQKATALLMKNYLNKVAEAQEKARLGAEIGFLN